MKVIGITGGMASGKSTVARMFTGRGIHHVDADKLVHYLMQRDKPTMLALKEGFPEAIAATGIDRAKLATLITTQPEKLALLEQILHPRVRALEERLIRMAKRRRARAIILDIPLLFETDAHLICDVVIAVRAPLPHRRRRAFKRIGMTEEKWQRLLSRQLPEQARCALADEVILTGIGKAATRREVQQLMKRWGLS